MPFARVIRVYCTAQYFETPDLLWGSFEGKTVECALCEDVSTRRCHCGRCYARCIALYAVVQVNTEGMDATAV